MPEAYELPRCRPEEQGVSSKDILSFIEGVERSGLELHGFMLLRGGHVVSEGFWQPFGPDYSRTIFSLSKSFTSTAIGFAASEGLISLEDRVISFFPEDLPEKPEANLSAMTIRHLLSMAAGHAEDTARSLLMSGDGNWVRAFLAQPVEHEPGTFFVYNSGASYMLSAILRKASGQNLLEYLTPRLFEPLGIEGADWEKCPRGTDAGGWGLSVRLEDIAKFGQLYLQKGKWLGKQLLPGGWTEEASSFKVKNGEDPESDWCQGYAYQFWRCRHNAYRGDGAFGQYCVVMPDQDAVFAAVSGLGDMQPILDLCWEHLLLPMQGAPFADNPVENAKLRGRQASLAYPPLKLESRPELESKISGKSYRLERNELGINKMRFIFDGTGCRLLMKMSGIESELRLGSGEWLLSDLGHKLMRSYIESLGTKVAASAAWQDDSTLRIKLRYVESPFCISFMCVFEEDRLRLQARLNVSFGPVVFPDITGYEA